MTVTITCLEGPSGIGGLIVIPCRVAAGAVCIEVFNLLNTSMRDKGAFQTLTAKINLDKARKSASILLEEMSPLC